MSTIRAEGAITEILELRKKLAEARMVAVMMRYDIKNWTRKGDFLQTHLRPLPWEDDNETTD